MTMSPRPDTRGVIERIGASDRHEFGDFFISRLLGLRIEYPNKGCDVTFEVTPEFTNPVGTLHGGILATAIDISMGHLLFKTHASPAATLEMKIQYLAPALVGELVVCRASFLRAGKSINFVRSEARNASTEALYAFATATWKATKPSGNEGEQS